MNLRLIWAELLKLRKRRGLFWWSLALSVGLITVVFAIVEILHLADPTHHGPAGGRDSLMGASIALTSESSSSRPHRALARSSMMISIAWRLSLLTMQV